MLSTILASVTITILGFGQNIPELGKCNEKYAGAYYTATATIQLCYHGDDKVMAFNKMHEVGHHFWFKFMNQAQRDEYTKLYEKDLKKGKFYRDYGRTSAVEDFAENFAVITTKTKHNNKRLPFIRKLLKNVHP